MASASAGTSERLTLPLRFSASCASFKTQIQTTCTRLSHRLDLPVPVPVPELVLVLVAVVVVVVVAGAVPQ